MNLQCTAGTKSSHNQDVTAPERKSCRCWCISSDFRVEPPPEAACSGRNTTDPSGVLTVSQSFVSLDAAQAGVNTAINTPSAM